MLCYLILVKTWNNNNISLLFSSLNLTKACQDISGDALQTLSIVCIDNKGVITQWVLSQLSYENIFEI